MTFEEEMQNLYKHITEEFNSNKEASYLFLNDRTAYALLERFDIKVDWKQKVEIEIIEGRRIQLLRSMDLPRLACVIV